MAETKPQFSKPFLVKDRLTDAMVRPPLLLCGTGNSDLGRRTGLSLTDLICERNGVDLQLKDVLLKDVCDSPASKFPDRDTRIQIGPQCTGREVVIFQTPFPDQDSSLMEIFLITDAARRAGAQHITAVLPYYAYGRQDRKDKPRVPISASLVANLLTTSGVNRIITLDLHADQTQGMIVDPWDNLYASRLMIPRIKEYVDAENSCVLSPDVGGIVRAKAYKERLKGQGVGFVIKRRDLNEQTSDPESLLFVGEVAGRDVVIVDDESVSFSSVSNAAHAAANAGAKKIIAVISHLKDTQSNGDFPKMWKNLNNLPPQFIKLLTTDSIVHKQEVQRHSLIDIVDTSSFWAEVIWRTSFGVPLSPDLID